MDNRQQHIGATYPLNSQQPQISNPNQPQPVSGQYNQQPVTTQQPLITQQQPLNTHQQPISHPVNHHPTEHHHLSEPHNTTLEGTTTAHPKNTKTKKDKKGLMQKIKEKGVVQGIKEKIRMRKAHKQRDYDDKCTSRVSVEDWRLANRIVHTDPIGNPFIDANRILTHLNEIRALYCASPVTWDPTLAKPAQLWAEHMAVNDELEHSARGCENVAVFSQQPDNDYTSYCLAAIDLWYEEAKEHDFKKYKLQFDSSNFTALVWRSVKQVGFGVCGQNGLVYVCMSMDPFANYEDQFQNNVCPLRDTHHTQTHIHKN